MFAALHSLASAIYHTSASAYRLAAIGLAGASFSAGWVGGDDLRQERERLAMAANRRSAQIHWRKAGRHWRRLGEEISRSWHDYVQNAKIGLSHTWQALHGVPRSQWQPPPPTIRWGSAFNPINLGFSVGFVLLAGRAAARRAEAEGRDPWKAAASAYLSSGLTMLAQQIVFGSSLVGGAAAVSAYLVYYGGYEGAVAFKHGARYRESYVRAAAAPWSFSAEPSDVAYQMMMQATQNTIGYAVGMEAAPMAARYSR